MDQKMEVKIAVAKVLEMSIAEDKMLTYKIMAEGENAKLEIDRQGRVTLTGTKGKINISGDLDMKSIGMKIGWASISFTNGDDMKIGYSGTVEIGKGWASVSIGLSGSFDLKELITSCSGLLCRAARSIGMEHRNAELQRIMGNYQ